MGRDAWDSCRRLAWSEGAAAAGGGHLHRLAERLDERVAVDDVLEPPELAHDEPCERHAAVGLHDVLHLGELLEEQLGHVGLERVDVQQHAHHAVLDSLVARAGDALAAHRHEHLPQAALLLEGVGEALDQVVLGVLAPHRAVQVLAEEEGVGQLVAVRIASEPGRGELQV